MPENRKYFPNKAVLLITTRAEHGIPMPPTRLSPAGPGLPLLDPGDFPTKNCGKSV